MFAAEEISKEYQDMLERDGRRWKVADTSGDDQLDKEEYGCFMHPEDCTHMRDVVVTVSTHTCAAAPAEGGHALPGG